MSGQRERALALAEAYFDSGAFKQDLARRVAIPTESQNTDRSEELERYISGEMIPSFAALGFRCRTLSHPKGRAPFLFAERIEAPELPTIFSYGHGDVVKGMEEAWKHGLEPWRLMEKNKRYWGRGVADNKGQHTIVLGALAAVLQARGQLRFNIKWLLEMGEEVGSPGLREICEQHRHLFGADVFIASDGPRLSTEQPTIYLGSRGSCSIDLWIDAREGAHHSGNWGGLLSNPAIQLAHAIAAIIGPSGQILVPELRPQAIPEFVRESLAECRLETNAELPAMDPNWGEPGLSAPEKAFAWSTCEVLAMKAGNPENPVNAIPPRASARVQVRFVAGQDPDQFVPALRRHLDQQGFSTVQIAPAEDGILRATRMDPGHPWVRWVAASLVRTTGKLPDILPNTGGSLPNDIFSELLGLPTIWIPHSYLGCCQHAPNEHLPCRLMREGLQVMAGIMWDLGESSKLTEATGGTRPVCEGDL